MATKPRKPKATKNDLGIQNGLTEAIMGFVPGGMGTEINQVDTIFKNNRWYLLSNMRQVLSQVYVEHGLIKTLVDVPVDDGLRGGYEITSKQLSGEQIQEIKRFVDRNGINSQVIGQAQKWSRLFGGAGIIIMTDQDASTPLNWEALRPDSQLEFRAVDMWELFYDKQSTEGYDTQLQTTESEYYNYYGVKVHRTRVMKIKGLVPPSFIRPRLRGWGFSVVENLVSSINQYMKSNNLTFEVLDEFKLDIFKIKNLTQTLLSSDGTAAVRRRIELANYQKNFQNALIMDGDDDYIQKQLTFAGVADMMKEFRIQIASDMRMPMTKLFGLSASGFNSGEDDIEVYNAMVEGEVRAKCKYEIVTILELVCQKLYGFKPDDLEITFAPLRILSSEQEEQVKNHKMNRIVQAFQAGLCSIQEAKESINKDKLMGVQVDTTEDSITMGKDEFIDEHKNLVKTLESPSKKDDKKEAEKQKEELKEITANSAGEIENPGQVDEALWVKAKEISKKEYGEIKWDFVTSIYKKLGGVFK